MRKRIFLLGFLVLLVLLAAGTALFLILCRPPPRPPGVEPPEGSQLLFFPIERGRITAGYRNPNYLEKWGYPHYGIDVTATTGGEADVLAAGSGLVLGTEHCDNNLGHIAVIRHDDVFLPQTGETLSLIGRYYHMTSLGIEEGDTVTQGQAIGTIDPSHEWYNHVHLELDTDLAYPFHTPQVAEASSEMLHRYPADGESIREPITILALGRGQQITVSTNSRLCEEKDAPRFSGP